MLAGSILDGVMACCLVAPSHFMIQCYFLNHILNLVSSPCIRSGNAHLLYIMELNPNVFFLGWDSGIQGVLSSQAKQKLVWTRWAVVGIFCSTLGFDLAPHRRFDMADREHYWGLAGHEPGNWTDREWNEFYVDIHHLVLHKYLLFLNIVIKNWDVYYSLIV